MALTVAQLVARVTADTSGFYRGMAIMNSSMIRTGGIASRVMAGVGLATMGVGILSLRAAGNFEQGMNVLQAVSGATESQMNSLRNEAIALGADFKLPNVSAKDAADAMVELTKGGLSVNRTLGATRGALQLGLAANIGFADSATLMARSLQAFDLEGAQAGRIANLLAAGANKSTAEITDLALGMQNAAAQFHGVGMPVEDLVASLSILADNALSGEYAGTALKTMLIRLTSPTDKARGVMDDLGISVFDAQGNMKSMPAVINEFQSAMGGLTQEQREQALTTIFGVRANQAMRILMGEGTDAYKAYRKEITGTNAAQEMAEARTKGFNGALGAAGSAVETLAIQLGTALLPHAEAAVRAFANFIASIDPQKIIDFFAAISGGIGWFIQFVKSSDAAQYILAGLAGAFVSLMVAKELIAIFKAVQIAWMLLNASFVASPLGLVVLAIGALVGALALAYMKSEEFRAIVDATFSWIKSNVLPILSTVANGIRTHFGTIKEVATTALRFLLFYWEQTWGRMVSFIISNWSKISAIVSAVLAQVLNTVRTVLRIIQGIFDVVMGTLTGDWNRAWNGIKQIVSAALSYIWNTVRNVLGRLVPAVLSLALAIGKAILTGIGNALSPLASFLWGKISSGVSSAISQVAGWAVGAAAAIGRAIMDGILAGVGGLAGALASKIKGAAQSALDSAKGFLGIGSPSRKFQDEVGKPISEGIILGFLLGARDLPDKISDSLKNALEKGKAVVDEYQSQFQEAFSQLASDALAAFDEITRTHRTRSEKLLDNLISKRDTEEFQKRVNEAKTALADAKSAIAAHDPASFETEEAATSAFEQLQADLTAAQEEWDEIQFQKKKMALEKKAAQERADYEGRRGLQRRHLEKELEVLIQYLLKHPLEHKKNQDKIIRLLNKYGVSYRETGTRLGKYFAEGIENSIFDVQQAALKLANAVQSILRIKSPADEGPLSSLDTWWSGFGKTLVSGLDTSEVRRAALAMAGMPQGSVGGGLALAQSGTSAAGLPPILHVEVHGSLIHEREVGDMIRGVINEDYRRGRTVQSA